MIKLHCVCVGGRGGGVEGIGLVKKLKWDLVTIRIRKYDLKWSKIVALKDQKVEWGSRYSLLKNQNVIL